MVSKGGAEVQRWRLSLRTAIAVPFAALFIGTVALQAVTQHRQIDALIDQESVRLLDAVTHTASDRLLHFLATPFRVQRSVADAIGRHGLYHAGDLRPIHEYLRAILTPSMPTSGRSACWASAGARANTPASGARTTAACG